MSITDELRAVAAKAECASGRCEKLYRGDLDHIADRIDAEHESAVRYERCAFWHDASDDELAKYGLLRAPIDADGVPIRVGDVVTMDLMFGGKSSPLVVDRMELSRGKDGELWCIALDTDKECWNLPSLMHHHHAPTVEDVLREFAGGLGVPVADSYVAATAAKLRLAEEEDA